VTPGSKVPRLLLLILMATLSLAPAMSALEPGDWIQNAAQLESQGQFKAAADLLKQTLENKDLPGATRKELEFEADRLERIKLDYPDTREQLFTELKESLEGLSSQEFEQWDRDGWFDSRMIDGQRYYMSASVSNLFFRHLELQTRRLPRKDTAQVERQHWQTCVAIKKAALAEHRVRVMLKRFEVTMTVTAAANAAPEGQTVRAWLPIPRESPDQVDFRLISASPAVANISPPQSAIRSIYFEQRARKDEAVQFNIVYAYTASGVWFNPRPDQVVPTDLENPELEMFTREAPHIVFTPEMRALSQQIAGDETNSLARARKFYEWIADHIQYSYALEYSTIRNLGEYCRAKCYGDCGQEALLFMTLCRLNHNPCRWQSGWSIFPGDKFMHDWTEIYLAPYGWLPVDPYMGIYAMRYATTLAPEQRREMRDFYFGGLDQYRFAANSDHCQPLEPAKRSMRSDNVDFQRGELEWSYHNIYFDRYSYRLTAKEVSAAH
jgi:transglutaminase-like putative cysteine protease